NLKTQIIIFLVILFTTQNGEFTGPSSSAGPSGPPEGPSEVSAYEKCLEELKALCNDYDLAIQCNSEIYKFKLFNDFIG
ncbi:hypothetical protein NL492_27450, partial [Klebsiella pneumoniae]|nr:hypothetical protein [Klebsiella pneumoniae]